MGPKCPNTVNFHYLDSHHFIERRPGYLCFSANDYIENRWYMYISRKVKKISNDQELIQSDPIPCPQSQKGNNLIYIN